MSETFDGEDKSVVEFQLGNKQLFFLFIGLLVIGAIIFFIGLRVGADSAKSKVALNLGAEEQQANAASQGDNLDEQELDVRPNIKPSTEQKKGGEDNKSVQLNMKEKKAEMVNTKDLPKTEKPKSKKKKTDQPAEAKKTESAKAKKTENSKPKTTTKASGIYYVQIAAPTNRARAHKMISKIPGGRNAEIMEKTVKGKVYYRVLVGPYKTKAEAEKARVVLNKDYKGAYIQIKK